jgi:hypothetical protein
MQKELYTKTPCPVRHDDLKFDGDNIVIPSYWASSIYDFLTKVNTSNIDSGDIEDLNSLKKFVADVMDYKTEKALNGSTYHFEETN